MEHWRNGRGRLSYSDRNVNQAHYRPEGAQMVPGSYGSQIS